MLKLTVRPGEYLLIGDDIKLVFAGGSSNNIRILVEAPKKYNIVRSEALVRRGMETESGKRATYYREKEISVEAKEKIKEIIVKERKRIRREEKAEKTEMQEEVRG